MRIYLRKNIILSKEENKIIQEFCKKIGKSFSEVVRIATINYIKEVLADNCEYVDTKEQEEIDELMKKLENDTGNGREISFDELLQVKK